MSQQRSFVIFHFGSYLFRNIFDTPLFSFIPNIFFVYIYNFIKFILKITRMKMSWFQTTEGICSYSVENIFVGSMSKHLNCSLKWGVGCRTRLRQVARIDGGTEEGNITRNHLLQTPLPLDTHLRHYCLILVTQKCPVWIYYRGHLLSHC